MTAVIRRLWTLAWLLGSDDGIHIDLVANMTQAGGVLQPSRVLVAGASGTIGQAVLGALAEAGHDVTGLVRRSPAGLSAAGKAQMASVRWRFGDVTDAPFLARELFAGAGFDVVVSTIASRTGGKEDSWAIDYQANSNLLAAARASGVRHMILLSAICVQQPELPFQHAKLAFEEELKTSGLTYSIVRPTAFFKSLSGQVERVRRGKPFMVFGDGTLTRCKPISDADLAAYVTGCIVNPDRHDRILPIGGPGPAVRPLDQACKLFELLGREPRIRHVPLALLDGVIGAMSMAGSISRKAANGADYARIARYYATHSMLVFDRELGCYSAAATPETGSDTLFDHYARLLEGDAINCGK